MLLRVILLGAVLAPATGQDTPGGYLERFQRAHHAYETGDLDLARAGYEECFELAPGNATVAFHLACTEARAGDPDEALSWLAKATDWGYLDAEVANWQPALESLHGHPEFAAILNRMRTGAAERSEPGTDISLVRLAIDFVHDRSSDGRTALLEDILWSIDRSEPIANLRTNGERPRVGAFDPTGSWVITSSNRGLFLWNARTGKLVLPLIWGKGCDRLSFNADGSLLATNFQGAVTVWKIPSGRILNSFGNVGSDEVLLDSPGERMVTLNGNHAFLWNVTKPRVIAKYRGVKRVGFRSDTGELMLVKTDGTSLRVRAQDGEVLEVMGEELQLPLRAILTQLHDSVLQSRDPCVLAGGTMAAVPCSDGSIRVFDLRHGRTVRVLAGYSEDLYGVTASPSEALVASWSEEGTVRVWDVASGLERATLEVGESGWFWDTKVEFSPDGKKLLVLSGADPFTSIVLDVATNTVLFELEPKLRTADAAWSPDSLTLASVGGDRSVHLWDVDTGLEKGEPLLHDEPLRHAAFHPDGVRLVVGGEHLFAHLWDTSTGQRLETFESGSHVFGYGSIGQVTFAPDGSLLVTTGGFYNVFCYDLDPMRQRWNFDFGGGCPAPLRMCVDDQVNRVALSWPPLVLGLDHGETLLELERPMGELTFALGDRYLIAEGNSATVVMDGASYETLYERREYGNGASLISSPSTYLAGDVREALDLCLSANGTVWGLRTYGAQLYDPLRVAASAAGVPSLAPHLPLPPETVLVDPETLTIVVREVARLTVEARAADGVIEFEVVRDGELLPIHFEGKTVTRTGTGARLDLRLAGPVDQDVTTLLIRPISGAGVVGHATLRELHWE